MNQNIGTPQDAHITGIIQDWKIDSNYRNDSQSIPVFFSTNFNISISVTSGAVDYNNKNIHALAEMEILVQFRILIEYTIKMMKPLHFIRIIHGKI